MPNAALTSALKALALSLATSDDESVGYDDDFGYSWEPLKPYLDGDTLVIPVLDVIADSFWGSCLSAKMVQRALLKHKSAARIKLLVNCPGGNVTEGTAIYSLLVADGRPVEAHVIGLAASMATVVILAAEVRVLHTGCMLMVHEPALSWTGGNRHQLRSDATRLDIATESMLDIYEERTGHPRAELAALMAAETWLSAEDGRRIGLGTEVAAAAAEPVMSAVQADEGWNTRRGAALAKYSALPATVQQGTELGWSGPSLADLRAAHSLAEANNYPTLTMALDGVRRSRAVAQQPQPRETPTPRSTPAPQPAATASRTNTMPFPKELLDKLGLTSSATEAEVFAAMTAKATEAETLAAGKADAEARAKAEEQARREAEASAKIAEERRKQEAEAAAEVKALADWTSKVQAELLEDTVPSLRADFEAMAFTEVDGKKVANPDGFARALRMRDTMVGARKSSLTGPSAQAQAARQTVATTPPPDIAGSATGPVMFRFKGATATINLTKFAGVTHEKLAARMAKMKARAEAREQLGE
jgi:ATP-dependent Clp protease protease subunit